MTDDSISVQLRINISPQMRLNGVMALREGVRDTNECFVERIFRAMLRAAVAEKAE